MGDTNVPRCAHCDHPLGDINAACPNCLPNFAAPPWAAAGQAIAPLVNDNLRLRALNAELAEALADCSARLSACEAGTDPDQANLLLAKYRAVIFRAREQSDDGGGT